MRILFAAAALLIIGALIWTLVTIDARFPQVPRPLHTVLLEDMTRCAVYETTYRGERLFTMLCDDNKVRTVTNWRYVR